MGGGINNNAEVIELRFENESEITRPYDRGGDEGKWSHYNNRTFVFSHEFGHLVGLKDRYRDKDEVSVAHKGWEYNLMGTGRRLEQRNIDAVVKHSVRRYNMSDAKKRGYGVRYVIDNNFNSR